MTDIGQHADNAKKFTGWHMLAVVGAFFGVIISVNVVLAVMATTSWSGLVVKNTYVASQHFNEELAAARAQSALGWKSVVEHSEGGLTLDMKDRAGQPLSGLSVVAEVARPAHEGDTRTVRLTEDDGRYRADLPLAAGQWSVDVTAADPDGRRYRQIFRLFVKR